MLFRRGAALPEAIMYRQQTSLEIRKKTCFKTQSAAAGRGIGLAAHPLVTFKVIHNIISQCILSFSPWVILM
jgi:hypothetical protein